MKFLKLFKGKRTKESRVKKEKTDYRSIGECIEDISRLQQKAKVMEDKSKDDYVDLTIRFGKQITDKLDKCLNDLNNPEKDMLDIADKIYDILLETDLRKVEDAKDDYEYWYDMNSKLNS